MEIRVEVGEPSASLDLSRFLANWLINHIQAADRRFGAFSEGQQQA
jgi:hemerythrin